MTDLAGRRERARRVVEQVEADHRAAAVAVREATATLAEVERRSFGGEKIPAATRREAEDALRDAQARSAEPWAAQLDGARSALRDTEKELGRYVQANLRELADEVEERGEQAAQDVLRAAAELREAHARREAVASELGQLLALTGSHVRPADVGPPCRAQTAARECGDLLMRGEDGPRLSRYPGEAPAAPAAA
jgi:hypothetical protein